MLSTLTIISIFTEIFAAGIFLAGAYAFFIHFLRYRKFKNLYLGLFFLAFFSYVSFTIVSQMMFNMGFELSRLIQVQKTISISLIFCSIFLWAFILERFSAKKLRWSNLVVWAIAAFLIYRVIGLSVNLIYREGIIEPIVVFSAAIPFKPFFAAIIFIAMIATYSKALSSSGGRRTLSFFLGSSNLLLLISLFSSLLYIRFTEAGYLLASWGLVLISGLGILLAELIPEDTPEANRPLLFLRTRILFKLMLIFVLLIVILFEITTLATINISKRALSASVIRNYQTIAEDVVNKISAYEKMPTPETIQNLILEVKVVDRGEIIVVDKEGKLVAHPDFKRALQKQNVSANRAVAAVITGDLGGGEFRDEFGNLMVGAYVPVTKFGLGVVVEEPIAFAYFEIRRLETISLILVIIGIVLTALVGIFFARSIERPIKELTTGTEAVAKGDLRWQVSIDSMDEIGRLAAAFNQMTRDLRESQDRLILSEKLASLGTMAAGMAHEIKNPLVSVRTFTQLLEHKWEDPEFRKKFSTIIPHEIDRINKIAESLLKFGRPMKPELTEADVNALLEEVLLLFESECKKYNIRVSKKLTELPPVRGDAGQLQQVFVNIVKNAIEAMHEEGGELTIKTDVGEVVKLGRMGREGKRVGEEMIWGEEEEQEKPIPVVYIEIADTGEGIPEENLKSLFDPFFTTKMTGTGMGLPITLRIIKEHNGSIKVRSQAGKGTSFIITLPRKA